MRIAVGFSAGLLLLLTLLALNVSMRRLREKSYKHDEGSPALKLAQLAHRNAAEHVPMLALVVVLLALAGADDRWVIAIGSGALVARFGHAAAYLLRSGARLWASVLTYTVEFVGCGVVFWQLCCAA